MTQKVQKINPVRGTQDLLGQDMLKFQHILDTAQQVTRHYGYETIATPIFEHTSVFKRTLGETSDVVGKEMYTFLDRGGEELTLRPEGTASIVRALVSNGLTQNLPLKLQYFGPMLRYERPQLGRRRQFHQFGVEFLGVAHPWSDVETIALAHDILTTLGVRHKTVLHLNTLGDVASHQAYRQALIDYFGQCKEHLSPESQERLHKNPLRILDSKQQQDQDLVREAPQFTDYLNSASHAYFEKVCTGLSDLGVVFEHNPRLVRGLDYYTHTAFEFVTDTLGAQGTILAGGRYDGLVAQMGGPTTPGVGWALGIERIMLMLPEQTPLTPLVSIVPMSSLEESAAFSWAMMLRRHGITTDYTFTGNIQKRLKHADKVCAHFVVLIGTDECRGGYVTLKNMRTGQQERIMEDALVAHLNTYQPSMGNACVISP